MLKGFIKVHCTIPAFILYTVIVSKELKAVALCAVGAEKVLANEIRKLGMQIEEGGIGRVRYNTDVPGLYRSLYALRCADRVLLEAGFFHADNFDSLYEETRSIPFEEFIPADCGLKVAKVRSNKSKLNAEVSIQAVVHKAAAERLCQKYRLKRLPETPDSAELRVYLEKDKTSVLLDLTGDPLFKRGYRGGSGGAAPLRETTAAAIILLSLWKRKFPLYDPFCGSGTIIIEAALYAWDVAPGLNRRFAIENLLIGHAKTQKTVWEELAAKADFTRPVCIAGSDADKNAINNANVNLSRAFRGITGASKINFQNISFANVPFENVRPGAEAAAWGSPGFIITNPPYGKRLGDVAAAEETYSAMGKLAHNFENWKLAVITDHPGFESFFGKKADSCREITNGAALAYLFQYGGR